MMTIDGSQGEGGGQILRTSLALSMITGKPVCVENIRGGRKKPGLLRQHLTGLRLAQQICDAKVTGDEVGSGRMTFEPGEVQGGEYEIAVGTAGSAGLVLQTILYPLFFADQPSVIRVKGGTHNQASPPAAFLTDVFVPRLKQMGFDLEIKLDKAGFYPAGGGAYTMSVRPGRPTKPLRIGPRKGANIELWAVVSNLPKQIALRELRTAAAALDVGLNNQKLKSMPSPGPGNVAWAKVSFEGGCEVFTVFGKRGRSAETVGTLVAEQVNEFVSKPHAVGEFLADQLLIPMSLAQQGAFTTGPLSPHATTNMDIIEGFLGIRPEVRNIAHGVRVIFR